MATTDLGGLLVETVTRLRRGWRRAVQRDWPFRALTASQVELLLVVQARPGIGIAEAAGYLNVAPNTVSTLANLLAQHQMLTRDLDPLDRRAAKLVLTEAGSSTLKAWGERRARVLGAAMAELDDADRTAIATALPALLRLIRNLEARGDR